ncbi:uncharacterized protein LOC100250131 isoform X2 [Vitis vinifera]|uniref:uncharacterized protein LOC100250131 isoform X2 n=1 Tax=Vitis vinifera TaxID=29760 RepID=UPI0008FF8C26|nr:uncharacterized protein LOC100250131 isoform X2 [Vitis vinifera]|eukprot:XP_019077287.1 PREDICTED: RING finger and transmembrane domain-containing protein 2 isoform X2 [Vitis vinifera]
MEAPGGNYRGSSEIGNGNSRRYGMQLSASNIIQAPLSALLEYSGLLRGRSSHQETESLIYGSGFRDRVEESAPVSNGGEVSIRIIGAGEQENERVGAGLASLAVGPVRDNEASVQQIAGQGSGTVTLEGHGQGQGESRAGEGISQSGNGNGDGEAADGAGANGRDSSYQRYDIQQAARWIEQVLPFTLLLLVVFIRQHLQGFFVTIWISAVMFKSNEILRKQTALKGERKISVLVGISLVFTLHVAGVYWWYHNDTLVRQAAMVFKCILLMYYKNSRGRNYRKQGQLLTLVEYTLLLYRALLPAPVWYRFFLNKEYGSLFSSLMTGLYLTFKLTSVVEKVQSFFAALKALSRKEVHYGAYATSEQVNAAGDLCAICQEKMHAPILLRCKHIFCEDCVSEWFERERTCPLCRALVKPADLRSYGDGSTSLFFQLF